MKIGYNYHGQQDWIKQPNRLVKTFPSGLCMIQQDYIRRRDSVQYFQFKEGDKIANEDSAPCIDGAYIFPAPDYQDLGNGFIKCTVVAYGRVNTTGSKSGNLIQGQVVDNLIALQNTDTNTFTRSDGTTITRILSSTVDAVGLPSDGFFESITHKFVISQGEDIINNSNFNFKVFDTQGNQIKFPIVKDLGAYSSYLYFYDPSIYDNNATTTEQLTKTYNLTGEIKLKPILQNYQSINYGAFIEITATYSPRFQVLNFKR